MDVTDLLDDGYAWTTKRVAAVRAADLDASTPCTGWTMRQLLNHLLGALELQLNAVGGKEVDPSQFDPDTDRTGGDPASAFGVIADRAAKTWSEPGVLDRMCAMPFGPTPAPVVAVLHLTEVVLHGWDVTMATGENAAIPDRLATTLLEHAAPLVTAAHRGTAFGPELSTGDTSAERLLAFFGRTP